MNAMTLFHMSTSPEALQTLLEFTYTDDITNLVIYSIFPEKVTIKDLKSIAQVQTRFFKTHKIVYKNHIVLYGDCKLTPAARKALSDFGFSVEYALGTGYEQKLNPVCREIRKLRAMGTQTRVWLDVRENQRQVYETCRSRGVSVQFYDPVYDADGISWFDQWLYDKSATGVNTFTDLILMLTLQIRSNNCRYGSCLGRTVYADKDNALYLCPLHPDPSTCLGKAEGPGLQQLFENAYGVVSNAVAKRSQCVSRCKDFAYCQGGCPLNEKADASQCQYYTGLVRHISESLQKVYAGGDLETVNPIVKNAILNAIAFGTAFFEHKRKEDA